ncbi:DNA ligase Lig4 [Schizosaccharomyces japonicus yFS275]|uniref:DNA ligase n=1 Tax=Schizosaccharomyces japonicus (strain yFS275 / FY16936) TaxID=402676 RepID=B6K2R1_SCHJY|nr:DNA ligase Lig4 [Schizosaccharomyces japonicus yFS275]EEB07442.1 DNA ligase Lig4 [Schizosaccharomyces japonicus yFS275]
MTEIPADFKNHAPGLSYYSLVSSVLEPLSNTRKNRHLPTRSDVYKRKHDILETYMNRWREDVGPDLYPMMRLLLPELDRQRNSYGFKEFGLGKLFVRAFHLSPHSEDALALKEWKSPQSKFSGNFIAVVQDVINRRALRNYPSTYSIDDVNSFLDDISNAPNEATKVKVLEELYQHMSAIELRWLVPILLKVRRFGTSENFILSVFNIDAARLYRLCSSLKRVCYELHDPNKRLTKKQKEVNVFNCFQPQLANYTKVELKEVVECMHNKPFWIEEKLDGERIQLHYARGNFQFYSRNSFNITDVYGSSYNDVDSKLTKYLIGSFQENVREVILDGEMVTWDPIMETVIPYGSLRASSTSTNEEYSYYPYYVVFDILFLNGFSLLNYSLESRRKILSKVIISETRRMSVHRYTEGSTVDDIDRALKETVIEKSEGLVIKNPTSPYTLGERTNDWIKVKPYYMEGFGEDLDCLIMGGYYGRGNRKHLSSFLCGLRVSKHDSKEPIEQFQSFFRVGGGFTRNDYASIREKTNGKWHEWNDEAFQYHILAGATKTVNKPDLWIRPHDSIVLQIKAAETVPTDKFSTGFTLRFPRLQHIRLDKDWRSALTFNEFLALNEQAKKIPKEHSRIHRKKKVVLGKRKRMSFPPEYQQTGSPLKVESNLFEGFLFFVTALESKEYTKPMLEKEILSHKGKIQQSIDSNGRDLIVIANKPTLRTSLATTRGVKRIVRPEWVIKSIQEERLLPEYDFLLFPQQPWAYENLSNVLENLHSADLNIMARLCDSYHQIQFEKTKALDLSLLITKEFQQFYPFYNTRAYLAKQKLDGQDGFTHHAKWTLAVDLLRVYGATIQQSLNKDTTLVVFDSITSEDESHLASACNVKGITAKLVSLHAFLETWQSTVSELLETSSQASAKIETDND